MRVSTLLRKVLAVTTMLVTGVRFEQGTIIVSVRPRWRRARCGDCGERAPGYDALPEPRQWRSQPFGAFEVLLEYAMRRVSCAHCGIRVEQVPWARLGSRFTKDFEELVAYLARLTDKTTISELLGVCWRSVGRIVERIVNARLDASRLDGLRRIGIDEFSYRKRHRYLTVIVDHDRHRVVWAGVGRTAETLFAFFDELGDERLHQLETVTVDMGRGYLHALEERLPAHVNVVFDRFHVQRLASDAVDKVRRQLWREEQGTPEGDAVKGSRYALLKNPWNLRDVERRKLAEVQRTNTRLYRAYLLKETLAKALDYWQPKRAREALEDWLCWASRSRLKPFVRIARSIRKHKEGVLAYIQERLTNGIVEGFNNRLRMIARRAFGFHSPKPLIALLFLCCGGVTVNPPLPGMVLM